MNSLNHPSQTSKSKVKKLVRQNRYSSEIHDSRLFLKIGGISYEVINYSTFGIAILSEIPFEKGICIPMAVLAIENKRLATLDLKVVRSEQTGNQFKIAFEAESDSIPIELINLFPQILRIKDSISTSIEIDSKIDPEFKLAVYALQDKLTSIENELITLESSHFFTSKIEEIEFKNTVIDVIGVLIFQLIKEANIHLSDIIKRNQISNKEAVLDFFRTRLGRLLFQSVFAKRSFQKPLGYPGDFEMMNLLYRNENIGKTLFQQCIEHGIQLHEEPQAVRNRAQYLSQKIKSLVKNSAQKEIKILSVACGPAHELQKCIEELSPEETVRMHVYLLDQDENALKNAQKNLLKVLKKYKKQMTFQLILKNIKEVLTDGLDTNEFDLIYSAGLFDYFKDSVAQKAASIFLDSLKPKGTLVIGNFNTTSPNAFGMLSVFDWYLILRSETDLMNLYSFEEAETTIEFEPQKINLFASIRKR